MDGWGHGNKTKSDAIYNAKTPFIDSLYTKYPNAELQTCGEWVGLPEGQMGNSEVGHLNIGAGRVVYQELARINIAIRNKTFQEEQVLKDAFEFAATNKKKVHLLGLVSDGGVHAHIQHLFALVDMANDYNIPSCHIHAFTDGRDCDPKSGLGFIEALENKLTGNEKVMLSTICGRYYAMDRDRRWERVKLAYDLVVHGIGDEVSSGVSGIVSSYQNDITDEFIKPMRVKQPISGNIEADDVVIFFNFRTDRGRELTEVLSQCEMPDFNMHPLNLYYVTMTTYDATYRNVKSVYTSDDLRETLGEILANSGKTQIRIAETEKYPHVTFFFSGGRESQFEGEKRIMIPSPKVATYDLMPEMSAYGLTEAIIPELKNKTADFICLNLANADMVGHTGVYDSIIKAVETVDTCVARITEEALKNEYTLIITADHGNSDYVINDDGSPNTAHTTNLVPVFLVDNHYHPEITNGKLADLAPTILELIGLPKSKFMDGKSLIK